MIHILLHFAVPLLVGLIFLRSRWGQATLIMVGTMLVDLDHLLADPIYDPERCSIGFHPLHTMPLVVLYVAMFLIPLLRGTLGEQGADRRGERVIGLIGLGLLIHMALDWLDCVL